MINIGNYSFEGPYSNVGYLQNRSGVYVILSASNHVVDVGESATVKDRIENHDRKFCWQRHGECSLSRNCDANTLRLAENDNITEGGFGPFFLPVFFSCFFVFFVASFSLLFNERFYQ